MKRHYDFDAPTMRKNTDCTKWDTLKTWFGRDDLLPLWIADMDFEVPEAVTEAILKRAEHKIYGYNAFPEGYHEAFAAWQKKRHGWDVGTDWLIHTPGVLVGLTAALMAFTDPGDAILIQPPVYHPFRITVESMGRKVVENPLRYENGRFELDFGDLEKKAREAKALLLCSPHNPSGRVWTREELLQIEKICRDAGLLVLSDEIHSDILYWGNRHIPFASLSDWSAGNTVTMMAPSKTFNIAGLATSTVVVADADKRKPYLNVVRNALHVGNGNAFGLVACKAAYLHGEEWLEALLKYLEQNILHVEQELERRVPRVRLVHPEATYIPLVDFRELGMTPEELKTFLTDKALLAMNQGTVFGTGGAGFARLNVATQKATLDEFLTRLEKSL